MGRGRRMLENAAVRRTRLDPIREITIETLTDGPSRGWIHTHGLARHGKPELEIRGAPLFMSRAGAAILNDIADYLLNDATQPLLPGQTIDGPGGPIRAVEGRADESLGYPANHYATPRLTLVDAESMGCGCDECAKEKAARSPFRS